MASALPSSPFTVLFIQGSWHVPRHASPLSTALSLRGIETVCPLLPSNDIIDPEHSDQGLSLSSQLRAPASPLPDGHVDAQYVREQLQRLIVVERKNVLLVAHSYGGLPATEAAKNEFNRMVRQRNCEEGGLLGIFYVCSFPLPLRANLMSCYGTVGPATETQHGISKISDCSFLFDDLPPQDAQHWASLLVPQSVAVHVTALEYAGYLHVPCGYLFCENDKCVPLSQQQQLVQGLREMGVEVATWSCPAGHEPALSWTESLRDVLVEFGNICLEKRA